MDSADPADVTLHRLLHGARLRPMESVCTRQPCFARSHREPEQVESRRHLLLVQGVVVDTCVCIQRYCLLRRVYLVHSRQDPLFCLVTSTRIPELELVGPGPDGERRWAW